jgi:hypothetical protein
MVTKRTVLTGIVLINQGYPSTMQDMKPHPESSLGSWGVAEPCVAGACIAESYQNILLGSCNLFANDVECLVSFHEASKAAAPQASRLVGLSDDVQDRQDMSQVCRPSILSTWEFLQFRVKSGITNLFIGQSGLGVLRSCCGACHVEHAFG